MGASSSDYSECNIDEKRSSQVWKSREMLGARTVTPVDDKFVIDDYMDSDTATESDLSLKSQSFLHKVNDRVRKILDHSSKDAMRDNDKHSLIWRMFVFSIGSISIHGKESLRNFTFHQKKQGKISLLNRSSTYLKKLIVEQSDGIFGVTPINWRDSSWKIIFGQWWRSHQSLACKGLCIFRFCVNQNSASNTVWEDKLTCFKDTTKQNFGHNWRRADGLRVEYFPRIHHIAARRQSTRFHKNSKDDLSSSLCSIWHQKGNDRQCTRMYG